MHPTICNAFFFSDLIAYLHTNTSYGVKAHGDSLEHFSGESYIVQSKNYGT